MTILIVGATLLIILTILITEATLLTISMILIVEATLLTISMILIVGATLLQGGAQPGVEDDEGEAQFKGRSSLLNMLPMLPP